MARATTAAAGEHGGQNGRAEDAFHYEELLRRDGEETAETDVAVGVGTGIGELPIGAPVVVGVGTGRGDPPVTTCGATVGVGVAVGVGVGVGLGVTLGRTVGLGVGVGAPRNAGGVVVWPLDPHAATPATVRTPSARRAETPRGTKRTLRMGLSGTNENGAGLRRRYQRSRLQS
jgi:hypothetical protein